MGSSGEMEIAKERRKTSFQNSRSKFNIGTTGLERMYAGWGDCGKSPAKTCACHAEEIEVWEDAQTEPETDTSLHGGYASQTSIPAPILVKDVLNVTRNLLQAYPGFFGIIDPDFLKDGSCSLFSRLDALE